MSQFQPTTSLLKEITPYFYPAEDTTAIKKVHRLRDDAQALFEERQRTTKALIKGAQFRAHFEKDAHRVQKCLDPQS
jgi:hypothetical protein